MGASITFNKYPSVNGHGQTTLDLVPYLRGQPLFDIYFIFYSRYCNLHSLSKSIVLQCKLERTSNDSYKQNYYILQ